MIFLQSTCTQKASQDPSFPVCDTESDLRRGWLGLASLVPTPHLARISLCTILKAICAGVGFGSGTETRV